MEPRTSLSIVANKGIAGDASYGRRTRQILLVSIETLEAFKLSPGDLRENVVIKGLAIDSLPPETNIIIGDVTLSITGSCQPCSQMDELRTGLQEELQGRRGVLARALSDGKISVGDRVEVLYP